MLKIIASLFLLLFSTHALSLSAAQNLEALLSPIQTLQANFKQTTTARTAEFILKATGQVKVNRPGKFYWQVNKPGKQVIIINKGMLWLYDVDLQQVTIKKMSGNVLALNPASLLSGDLSALLKNNLVEQSGSSFTLRPRTNNDPTQWIKIVFSSNTLRKLQYENRMGQLTTIEFSELIINKPISDNFFILRAPKGTDTARY